MTSWIVPAAVWSIGLVVALLAAFVLSRRGRPVWDGGAEEARRIPIEPNGA